MRLAVKVDCDNAAFADNGLAVELGSILMDVVERLYDGDVAGTLVDSNGNTVGSWELQ